MLEKPIQEITCLKCTCQKCGNEWVSTKDEPPKQCPQCKNPKWQVKSKSLKRRLD
jgi:rubrerythrin